MEYTPVCRKVPNNTLEWPMETTKGFVDTAVYGGENAHPL